MNKPTTDRYEWIRGQIGLHRVVDDEVVLPPKPGMWHRLVADVVDVTLFEADERLMVGEHVRHTASRYHHSIFYGHDPIGSTTSLRGITRNGQRFEIEIRVGEQRSRPGG